MGTVGLLTYRGAVYPIHCDHIGHMNVASYVAKFDEASWSFFCVLGLTPLVSARRPLRHGRRAAEHHLSAGAVAGDVLEVRSRVVEIGDKRIRFEHIMYNVERGEVAASSEITAVHLDKVAHKASPFPAAVREKAQALLRATGVCDDREVAHWAGSDGRPKSHRQSR